MSQNEAQLAGREVTVAEMAPIVARRFEDVFDIHLEPEDGPWPPMPQAVTSAEA